MAKKNRPSVFLNELAETSNIKAASIAAGISQSAVYNHRRGDPAFARQWYGALAEGYDNLEMELLGRLHDGPLEDTDEEGNKRKFDIGTAFRRLVAHRESVSREKGRRTLADEIVTMKAINAKIDAIRGREERAAALAAKWASRNTDAG